MLLRKGQRHEQSMEDFHDVTRGAIVGDVTDYVNVNSVCDTVLNLEKVIEIEKELDLNEKISLIYLLYDSSCAPLALQYSQLQNDAISPLLKVWVFSQMEADNQWKVKLMESLAIIQNYYILCELLGCNRKDLQETFSPLNESTSLNVDLLKKKLYRLAENLDNSTTKEFLQIVRRDFKEKGLHFEEYDIQYLEIYFLYWTVIGYITPYNLKNLCKAFEIMNRFDVVDSLEDIMTKSISIERPVDPISQDSIITVSSTGRLDVVLQNEGSIRNSRVDNIYKINSKYPGVCLIINQEYFYTEFDRQYLHLLPAFTEKVENRIGTNADRNKLEETFEKLGFKVIVENNLTHFNIKPTLIRVIDEIQKETSLIVCILSHGSEGKIYGVNSIPVKVQEIQNIMCQQNPKLINLPKVLILQSCQGQICQEVSKNTEVEETRTYLAINGLPAPNTTNMLVFWATVPGYGAIRDKKSGSWFIQSLCKKIEEEGNGMHFADICTMVHKEVINKRWETETSVHTMVPVKVSTFSKFFYLPQSRI